MKMYGKKLSALLAAMLLLVTTAACGQKADNGNTSEPDALTPVYSLSDRYESLHLCD